MQLLDKREAANAHYSVFKDKLQRLGEVLGRKRVYGAQDFLDFVANLTPEKVADKLSGKNNSEFLSWFSKEFPEGMKSISEHQKGIIRNTAMDGGKLSTRRALSAIDKMPEEYRAHIFTPEQLTTIGHVDKYVGSFPKSFNPSNTANASAFRMFFESPVSAATSNLRDTAIDQFINGAVNGGEHIHNFVDALSTIERNAAKTTGAITKGISDIFETTSKDYETPVSVGIKAGESIPEMRKNLNKKVKTKLDAINPEQMIDHISNNTEALYHYAPQTAAAVQDVIGRAVGFLKSKIPSSNKSAAMDHAYEPSVSELSKWHKYFLAVDAPTDALQHVASGTLVPETMEAVSVVYPKLLSDMRHGILSKMADLSGGGMSIPYSSKLSLSLFMGQDLVGSLNPTSMMATQNMLSAATQSKQAKEQSAGKPSAGTAKINQSNRLLTSAQSSAQRQGA
jgi:hypothetical protein